MHWVERSELVFMLKLTSTDNARHEDFMHAALSQGKGDRPSVHRQTCSLGRVHLLKANLIAVLNEPVGMTNCPLSNICQYSLQLDNVQTLVYASSGPLYAAHFVISPLALGSLLPAPIPPILHFPGLLWFHPLCLLCKD